MKINVRDEKRNTPAESRDLKNDEGTLWAGKASTREGLWCWTQQPLGTKHCFLTGGGGKAWVGRPHTPMVMAISQVLPGIQWAQSNGPPKQALDPAPAKNTGRLTLAKRGQLRACPGLAQAGLTFSFLPAPLVSLKFQSSSEELSLHREGRGLFAFCSFPDNLVTVCSGHTEKKNAVH